MFKRMFTNYRYSRIRGRIVKDLGNDVVADRQEIAPGFDQQAMEKATITLIGAGGINSEVGEGLVRKRVGCLKILDPDEVSRSNLNRQFYFTRDLYKSKGLRLPRNLAKHSTRGTLLFGYDLSFQDAIMLKADISCHIVICGVDNNPTRVDVSKYYRALGIPVLFLAVDRVAESGYCFVQESCSESACFGCAFPSCMNNTKVPCRTPAVKDVLKIVAGMCLYGVDSLLMDRARNWNYRNLHVAGYAPSNSMIIEKNMECPLCGKGRKEQ